MTDAPKRRRAPNKRQLSNAALAERDEQIWQLRLQGMSLRQIGALMGLGHVTVKEILDRGYAERIYPKVDDARVVESERLDYYLTKLQPAIEEGSDKAISAALRVSERRAKLLGLDTPVVADLNLGGKVLHHIIEGVSLEDLV